MCTDASWGPRACGGPPGEGTLTRREGVELNYREESSHGAIEGVQGPRCADTRGQPSRPGYRMECQMLCPRQGPAVGCYSSGQAQGQAQAQAQQGYHEAGRARHEFGRVGCTGSGGGQRGPAPGRPCILLQPSSLGPRGSTNRPDRFGLWSYQVARRERRKGRGGGRIGGWARPSRPWRSQ